MELNDNISRLLGDDLKRALKPGVRLKVAASCFSMYAFEALKAELEQVDELHFIFTSPTCRESIRSAEPERRTVAPHALGHGGFRWHVRAYCQSRKAFRDFVIARILNIKDTQVPGTDGKDDDAWHRQVRLPLAPNPKLAEATQRVTELDYGMASVQLVDALCGTRQVRAGWWCGREPQGAPGLHEVRRNPLQQLLGCNALRTAPCQVR